MMYLGPGDGLEWLDVWLTVRQPHRSCSFQPIVIVHSLPKTLFVWALLLFTIQGFWMTFTGLTPHILIATLLPIAAVLVTVCACIWRALHPSQKPFEVPILSAPVPPPVLAEDHKEHHMADLVVWLTHYLRLIFLIEWFAKRQAKRSILFWSEILSTLTPLVWL